MSQLKDGCVAPVKGPILPESNLEVPSDIIKSSPEVDTMRVSVGKEAIDFEATAFVKGFGFKPIKLSDYKGKWIVLCFYPGDFTFV